MSWPHWRNLKRRRLGIRGHRMVSVAPLAIFFFRWQALIMTGPCLFRIDSSALQSPVRKESPENYASTRRNHLMWAMDRFCMEVCKSYLASRYLASRSMISLWSQQRSTLRIHKSFAKRVECCARLSSFVYLCANPNESILITPSRQSSGVRSLNVCARRNDKCENANIASIRQKHSVSHWSIRMTLRFYTELTAMATDTNPPV